MKTLSQIAGILVLVGALNWGFAVFNFNLVTAIFQEGSFLTNLIYALVGLSALWVTYEMYTKPKGRK